MNTGYLNDYEPEIMESDHDEDDRINNGNNSDQDMY
jgi:hypothetical protein